MKPISRCSLTPHTHGLTRGELQLSVCARCATPQFPPKAQCSSCGDTDAPDWVACAGTGRLWSFAAFHKAYLPDFDLPTPYVVAVIALDEGVRLYGNVVGTPSAVLRVGLPVRAEFGSTGTGVGRLAFTVERQRNQ
jgi:uncharacterized OB-fold protein